MSASEKQEKQEKQGQTTVSPSVALRKTWSVPDFLGV
jgi:hypothetical protein